jgi:hypothetical protein
VLTLGEAIFTKDKPLPVSVRAFALPALDIKKQRATLCQ